jgi:hypothetical protein
MESSRPTSPRNSGHFTLDEGVLEGPSAGTPGRPDRASLCTMASLNVLYTVTHGEMGGVHRFLDSLFACHSPDVVRPVLLSFKEGPWLDDLRARGLPVYCIDMLGCESPRAAFARSDRSCATSEFIWFTRATPGAIALPFLQQHGRGAAPYGSITAR